MCVEENGKAHNTTNEPKVVQMLGIDTRMRIDLQCVIVMSRIFKQAVERIEHFMREQEEEFSWQTTIIQTILAIKFDHETFA